MDQHESATRPHKKSSQEIPLDNKMPTQYERKYTARSPELLLRMFNAYPILESVLSCSHRPDIVNLARTCHTLHLTFTTTVGKLPNLRKAFPSCTTDLKRCFLCNIPVCERCQHVTDRQETPGETLGRLRYEYALLGRNVPHDDLLARTRGEVRWNTYSHIKRFFLCEICRLKPEAIVGKCVQRDWSISASTDGGQLRQLQVPMLPWLKVPNVDTACPCDKFGTECEALPHLVRVESLPIQSELVAMAYTRVLPPRFSSSMPLSGFPAHDFILQYYIPFYVMD
ncbi:hypothetical protein L211DRAFT_851707 [Terfezia boudieri ATCC MYA-4762]|uniref:Uncharacterized protein n=1 Tax=Terfezia boudieri ATCC MYA-4762 TaxID=1051890 RepID=A0A3N4LE97_9PEZI|nr:hypothetical protein L211DRAFT_851707 [Terfezia boudieri ATCC MYA-4762]